MMTPDAGLKSTPSTSKPSEEDARPHDDDPEMKIKDRVLVHYKLCLTTRVKELICKRNHTDYNF